MQIVEQWNEAVRNEQIRRCFISHQVATEVWRKLANDRMNETSKKITSKWLFMIGFLIELFVDRFLRYFSSFSICNCETMWDAFVIISQWPRSAKPNRWRLLGRFMHTKVTDQSVKIFIIIWKFIFFTSSNFIRQLKILKYCSYLEMGNGVRAFTSDQWKPGKVNFNCQFMGKDRVWLHFFSILC